MEKRGKVGCNFSGVLEDMIRTGQKRPCNGIIGTPGVTMYIIFSRVDNANAVLLDYLFV